MGSVPSFTGEANPSFEGILLGQKIWSEASWKRFQRSLQNQLERKKRNQRVRLGKARQPRTQKSRRRYFPLNLPSVFSFHENPEGAIRFLRSIQNHSRNHNLILNFKLVEKISIDGIMALLATMGPLIQQGVVFIGNQPNNAVALEILRNSGFFDFVKTGSRQTEKPRGKISQRTSMMVEADTAADLIRFGTAQIHGSTQQRKSAQTTLLECMANTQNHAAGADNTDFKEMWWAAVYADMERRRVCYAFLDTGVGIMRSGVVSQFRRAYRKLFRTHDHAKLLRHILEGKVESRTGLEYRGLGLPAIRRRCLVQRGIHSLNIITNDVHADVARGEFRNLATHFRGTLLYWETD